MIRTYATPLAFKAALEARIGDRARARGRPLNRVRQLFVMERFLVRVFDAFESAVVKGGLVMELRLERARTTRDVDLRIDAHSEGLIARLQAAARGDGGDHLTFEVEGHADHPLIEADGLQYEGQRFQVLARLAGRPYGDVFGVDVALGEPIVGTPQSVSGNDLLAFIGAPTPVFRAYPVPTHLAEKLHAYTLPRRRPNSRVKDLPDMALLATAGALDASAVAHAIAATFAHRGTHAVPVALPSPAHDWAPVYERMAIADDLPWRTLSELLAAVQAFVDPVLEGDAGRWDPKGWAWRDEPTGREP